VDATFTKNERFTHHLVTGKDEQTTAHEDRTCLDALQPVVVEMITLNFVKNVFYIFFLC
jgi:hypothetical protein